MTEEPSPGTDGSRSSHTPTLGIHHTWVSASGDAMVNEDRLRAAIAQSQGDPHELQREIDRLLGADWDDELEPFRYAGDGAPVRWLHKVADPPYAQGAGRHGWCPAPPVRQRWYVAAQRLG